MRIAIVSYEYPPDTGVGGIGTYAWQAASLLAERGHAVEVFAASNKRSGHFEDGNVGLNLVSEMDRIKFRRAIAPVFAQRHAVGNFDVVESAEYFADGYEILQAHPNVPHVVKLHTPTELIRRVSFCAGRHGWLRHNLSQARVAAGALRRGKRPPRYQGYRELALATGELDALEKDYAKRCSFVTSPSIAMAEWGIREWGLDRNRTRPVPNPYIPAKELLTLPQERARKVIGFFGRLEYRKGLCCLVEAIPRILQAEPTAQFRFVGKPLPHPDTLEPFDQFILRKLKRHARNMTIVGTVPLQQMPSEYAKVDVCVYPSVWENFPYVCLEAMSAGKAVVGSNAGGMTEMLEGDCGLLAPPDDPQAVADAVVRLLRSDDLRMKMGQRARQRVLERYSKESIGPQIEKSYHDAIAAHSLAQRAQPVA